MASDYDPFPDAIALLSRKSPAERHAIARLLDVDGTGARLLQRIAERPDCDRASAAMIYWRLRGLAVAPTPTLDLDSRKAAIAAIDARVRAEPYATSSIAWDGREAWTRQTLIEAVPIDGLPPADRETAAALAGPFAGTDPGPAKFAFIDEPYDQDDIFDSLWREYPTYAAAADWLAGKSPEVWMTVVDDLASSHANEILMWMVQQPECATSVAGRIFWLCDPVDLIANHDHPAWGEARSIAAAIVERWHRGDLIASDIDFSRFANGAGYRAAIAEVDDPLGAPPGLIDPPPGRIAERVPVEQDFEYWCWRTDIGNLVARPRAAAIAQWQTDIAARRSKRPTSSGIDDDPAAPPSWIEQIVYGGKFTGSAVQQDRAWRQFLTLSIGGALLFVAVGRWGSKGLGVGLFMAWIAIVGLYQSSISMGGRRRLFLWWVGAIAATVALTMVFRWLDFGGIK